jgi:hypothetical protein
VQDHGEEVRKPAEDPRRSAPDEASGRVTAEDPARAPLGTDAQAAGAVTPAQHIDRTAPLEDRGEPRAAPAQGRRRGWSRGAGLLIFVALVVIAVASALLMFR